MAGVYAQKGPRAHNFAACVSIVVGLSVFFEYYASNITFTTLSGLTPLSGQHLWGLLFFGFGLLLLQPFSIILRAINLVILSAIWSVFGLFSLWVSLFSPWAHDVGSAFGILAVALAVVCILATSNLKRDFYQTNKNWLKANPLVSIVDPHRAKRGDSTRE